MRKLSEEQMLESLSSPSSPGLVKINSSNFQDYLKNEVAINLYLFRQLKGYRIYFLSANILDLKGGMIRKIVLRKKLAIKKS